MALTFEELLAAPPELKQFTSTLPDGREYTLHELPLGVVSEVFEFSKKAQEGNRDIDLNTIASIAARSMLGRKPKPKEVKDMIDALGNKVIVHIYSEALKFSQLGQEAVDEAKKD